MSFENIPCKALKMTCVCEKGRNYSLQEKLVPPAQVPCHFLGGGTETSYLKLSESGHIPPY